jgi:predicted ATPase
VITRFDAENYGPIKSATATLTPLHAFIGPNDSGKSTILRGIVTAINLTQGKHPSFPTTVVGKLQLSNSTAAIVLGLPNGAQEAKVGPRVTNWPEAYQLLGMTGGARLARFEADVLRQPSNLITEERAFEFVDNRGLGLPGVYDILNNRNDDSFETISDQMKHLFPTVSRLRLRTVSPTAKVLAIELRNGAVVSADGMSEGMLYYLAYAALRRLAGISLLAVEEPETGLHPSRIADVIRILREISTSGVQVVLATHSPLVVNEMKPDEVSVVTRTAEEGTKVQRISDTHDFQKRSKVYELGELWVSYANGLDEGPLLKGDPA